MASAANIFAAGFQTLAAGASAPALEIGNFLGSGVNFKAMGILQIALVLDDATAADIGLIASRNRGDPKTFFQGGTELIGVGDGTPRSAGYCVVDWNTAPTIDPVNASPYMAQVPLPAIAGSEVSWTWDEVSPLVIQPGSSLLIWNLGAAGISTMQARIRWAENAIVSPYRSNYAVDPVPGSI